ncbi:phage protein [Pseudomonas fluorescens]|nr:phage protein [Pseudomonas fluorescens]
MSANQLAVTIDDISEANAPAIYVKDGLKPFLQAVKEEVSSQVPDLTTAKGRARIASLAKKVSDSKVAVEKPGRDYLRRLKEMPKVVEVELKEFVDAMNALRDETRKPLTDWEAAEQARKDKHVDGIQAIKDFLIFEGAPSADQVGHIMAILELVAVNDTWEEFLTEAAQVKDETLAKLRNLLAERTQYEAEQAELVRLRAEAEAQAQRDRDAEIARVAAEQARLQAEQQAQAEREAAARREQELLDQAAAAQRATEQAARDAEAAAERQRLQLQLQAEQAERQAAQAEVNRIATEQRAEQDRLAAIRRQEEAVEQARLAEVARANAAADEILRQQKAREADSAHKIKILGEAKQALIGMNISEELAKAIILKIARGEVPNVTISF